MSTLIVFHLVVAGGPGGGPATTGVGTMLRNIEFACVTVGTGGCGGGRGNPGSDNPPPIPPPNPGSKPADCNEANNDAALLTGRGTGCGGGGGVGC